MSAAYDVLDEHYLAISALITIGIQFVCFLFCWFCKFDTITDFSAATNFIIIMILSLILGNTYSTRAVVNTVMACVSRLFLAGLLLYRVCKRGKDSRFDEAHEMLIKMVIFWVAQVEKPNSCPLLVATLFLSSPWSLLLLHSLALPLSISLSF